MAPSEIANSGLPPIYAAIHQSLRQWHSQTMADSLHQLCLLRQFPSGDSTIQVARQLLLDALDELQITQPEHAQLLRWHFIEDLSMLAVAPRLHISEATANRWQRDALRSLSDVVEARERTARLAFQARFVMRLEAPSYERLFGIDESVGKLSSLLVTPTAPWLLLLEGMGGLGKTALADTLMRHAITHSPFVDFAWISARQQRFVLGGALKPLKEPMSTPDALIEALARQLLTPISLPFNINEALTRLQNRLQSQPHLIVIDNLETLDDVEELLPSLRRMVNPTKFLLTSRSAVHSEQSVYHFPVAQLSLPAALALIRHEAQALNLPTLAQSSVDELRPIYEMVGGNPLALRLVVGQTRIYPLPTVLEDLRNARGAPIEALYTHLYQYAWQHLDDTARRVLLSMALVIETGADLPMLVSMTSMEPALLRDALAQLVTFNLVNRLGDLATSRYTIHSLTRAFLHNQVARWM